MHNSGMEYRNICMRRCATYRNASLSTSSSFLLGSISVPCCVPSCWNTVLVIDIHKGTKNVSEKLWNVSRSQVRRFRKTQQNTARIWRNSETIRYSYWKTKVGLNTSFTRQPTDTEISFAIVVHISSVKDFRGLHEFCHVMGVNQWK